jgi:GWxTD domain-containing protein
MKRYMFLVLAVLVVVFAVGCGTKQQVKTGPLGPGSSPPNYRDSFFDTARLIMTKEEIDIYKHLPDRQAREEFIIEFWKKRDPDPETEENENKEEFDRRVAFAVKWFTEHSKGRGWDTERGRILIQLGFPEERRFGEAPVTRRGRLVTSKRIPMELWTYYRYRLQLQFANTDDSGRLRLTRIPSNLLTVMDLVKFSLDLRDQDHLKRAFKFSIRFKDGNLNVSVPVKNVNFAEKGDEMSAEFGITVYVYRDNKKVDVVKTQKSLLMDKDELLEMKNIEFSIPYPVSLEGKYYFDVVIEDKNSTAKYRNFVTHKV